MFTSNVTSIAEDQSASAHLFAGKWCPLVSVITYYTSLLCCEYLSLSSVVLRAFSALCVYLKFRHHPHPLGYLCAKFCFFRGLHCWASPWRKIAYSVIHPAYLMPREPKRKSWNRNVFSLTVSLQSCLVGRASQHVTPSFAKAGVKWWHCVITAISRWKTTCQDRVNDVYQTVSTICDCHESEVHHDSQLVLNRQLMQLSDDICHSKHCNHAC